MFDKGWTRVICVVLALAFLPMATAGCIGSFAAWNKLKDWNEGMSENKWVQELLFLVLHIIPVYPVAYLLDIVIINSIEFWTGDNPMMSAQTIVGEDGTVTTITPVNENRLSVTIVTTDGTEETFDLERGDQSIAAYDADGNLMVEARRNGSETELVHGVQ